MCMTKIVARISRYNPEKDNKPYYETYSLSAEGPLSILVILKRIQMEIHGVYKDYVTICLMIIMNMSKREFFQVIV